MAKRSTHAFAVLAGAALMLSGCSVAGPAAPGATAPQGAVASAAVAAPAAAAPAAGSGSSAAAGPSGAAAMVCGQEIRSRIAQILGLPAAPQPSSTWQDGLYTCTYSLPTGALVLSVKESADRDGALAVARTVAQSAGAAPIAGLANLGLPGYQNGTGTVVFAKDSFTLTVDAAGLAEPVGPAEVSRTSVAYQIATDVLACWSE